MSETSDKIREQSEKLKQQIDEHLKQLRTLRDEVKVDLHLATMELKQRWDKELEPRLTELENKAKQAADASRDAIREAIDKLRQFRTELRNRG